MTGRDPPVPVTVTVIVGAIPSLDEEIELELDELPAPSFTSPTKSILGRALAANAGTVKKHSGVALVATHLRVARLQRP